MRAFHSRLTRVVHVNGRSKPVQHFIQHHVFAMLDEMLEWFAQLQIYKVSKKKKKIMLDEVCSRTKFHPTCFDAKV